jgi:hypothetical protein
MGGGRFGDAAFGAFGGGLFGPDPIDAGGFDASGPGGLSSPAGRWVWARYLVGRAIGESLDRGLLVVGLLVLAGAALIWWAGSPLGGVLLGLFGLGLLLVRAALRALLRRLVTFGESGGRGPVAAGLRALVADTRADVLRELRRLGLPGRTWSLPWLAVRLLRRRTREATAGRLRGFDVDRVVPPARIDELHLVLQAERGRDLPRRG